MSPELSEVFREIRALASEQELGQRDQRSLDNFLALNEPLPVSEWVPLVGSLLSNQNLASARSEIMLTQLVSSGQDNPEHAQQQRQILSNRAQAREVFKKFIRHFFAEMQRLICAGKKSGATSLSIQSLGAGLASSIAATYAVTQPIAIAIATGLLVLVIGSAKGAFCQMDFDEFWNSVKSDDPPKKK